MTTHMAFDAIIDRSLEKKNHQSFCKQNRKHEKGYNFRMCTMNLPLFCSVFGAIFILHKYHLKKYKIPLQMISLPFE